MASQQVLFAETIAGMKKAFKRKAYGKLFSGNFSRGSTADGDRASESDSDSEVENHGNRGSKMKKRARFARRGQLVPTQGPSAYKAVRMHSSLARTRPVQSVG